MWYGPVAGSPIHKTICLLSTQIRPQWSYVEREIRFPHQKGVLRLDQESCYEDGDLLFRMPPWHYCTRLSDLGILWKLLDRGFKSRASEHPGLETSSSSKYLLYSRILSKFILRLPKRSKASMAVLCKRSLLPLKDKKLALEPDRISIQSAAMITLGWRARN